MEKCEKVDLLKLQGQYLGFLVANHTENVEKKYIKLLKTKKHYQNSETYSKDHSKTNQYLNTKTTKT